MSEQETQYEKKLDRIIGMLKENPNQREEINKGIDRLIYLRGRIFEQNQKNVQAGVSNSDTLGQSQTASSDNPQDDSGEASGAAKEDTGDSTFPADLSSLKSRIESCYDNLINAKRIGMHEMYMEGMRCRLDELILLYHLIKKISFLEACDELNINLIDVTGFRPNKN